MIAPLAPRRPQQARGRARSTWLRPLRGGIVRLDVVVEEDRADAVAVARQQARERRRELGRARAPSAARSGRSPSTATGRAGARRSARGPRCTARTYGVSIRAVTFQSMWRTSSPGSYSRRSAKSMPVPRKQRPVVALQQAVEPADHLPLEAVQEPLRRLGAEARSASMSLDVAPPRGHALASASSGTRHGREDAVDDRRRR